MRTATTLLLLAAMATASNAELADVLAQQEQQQAVLNAEAKFYAYQQRLRERRRVALNIRRSRNAGRSYNRRPMTFADLPNGGLYAQPRSTRPVVLPRRRRTIGQEIDSAISSMDSALSSL